MINFQKIQEKLIRPLIVCYPVFFIVAFALKFIRKTQNVDSIKYFIVGLGVNYFEFGAINRGLVGSLIYLSGVTLVVGTYLLYGISFVLFLALSYLIIRRMSVGAVAQLPFIIILAALLLGWASWIATTDMLVGAILLMAALAIIDERIVLASLCIIVGLAIHEVAIIYGLPLFIALFLDQSRYQKLQFRSLTISASIIAAGITLYVVVPVLPHSSAHTIVETIRSKIPHQYADIYTDYALYTIVSGVRSLGVAFCQNLANIHYFIHPIVGILIIALTVFCLSELYRSTWASPLIASVPPMVVLWIVATDMSRWVILSVLNVWIVCAMRNFRAVEAGFRWPWAKVSCAAVIFVLLFPGSVHLYGSIFVPSTLVEAGIEKVVGRPIFKERGDCDPSWRDVFDQSGK